VRVDPALDVEGLELLDGESRRVGQRVEEALEVVAVPLVGAKRAVAFAPVEVPVDERGLDRLGRGEELVVKAESPLAVGPEVVLAAAELDVPEPAVPSEPRLGEVRHVL
jgi:hypothetical protein